jgi:hypothetical protein
MTSFRWLVLNLVCMGFCIAVHPIWLKFAIIGIQLFCLYKQLTFKESPENGQEKTRE